MKTAGDNLPTVAKSRGKQAQATAFETAGRLAQPLNIPLAFGQGMPKAAAFQGLRALKPPRHYYSNYLTYCLKRIGLKNLNSTCAKYGFVKMTASSPHRIATA